MAPPGGHVPGRPKNLEITKKIRILQIFSCFFQEIFLIFPEFSWILQKIKKTLRRRERVELRGFGVFSTNTQKARISRNPKTGEKVHTPEKTTIHFKMAKDLFKKLNNEKE